eukprot:CAMPEP_0205818888 /NCGR_PEP_ID=MMETSP0206-20130828/986_1 /ASSEMBLY_ACC=CAM_ASM_000279 /TAXON_ID=36767 /ORGANISM="Euplotes focardii, Strain TN1" /LENGTH=306 /DNA_ID=CAMNT_0053111745 /DNA_START=55 /DNA_END=975 /DNA_ORIENTATION=-
MTVVGLAFFASYSNNAEQSQFQDFMQSYGVNYHDTAEFDFRFSTFQNNMKTVAEVASRNPLATFGVTKFSDRTAEEIKSMMSPRGGENYNDPCKVATVSGSAKDQDWRKLMGTVQDQGSCGGCWAFAVAAVTEGRYALSQGESTVSRRFSPQQLIDCDSQNSGCGGGFEAWAFDFFTSNDICDVADYPYKGRDGSCKGDCSTGIRVNTCSKITENDNKAAVIELANGPMDVAIDATDVMGYRGGIMTSCKNRGLDHAVTLVGYSASDNTVTIRNSWGAGWGEEGYFRVSFDGHQCGWDEDAHAAAF